MNNKIVIAIGAATWVACSIVIGGFAFIVSKTKKIKKIEKQLDEMESKIKKTAEKINIAIEDVEETSENKISEQIIRKGVERAADTKVDRFMQETEITILDTAKKDLELQARRAVEAGSKDIREKAAEEISRQVEIMDIELLKSRVCDLAEKRVSEKLEQCTDEAIERFRKSLEKTEKMYDGIARSVEKRRLDDIFWASL